MRRILGMTGAILKWLLVLVVSVEVMSFIVISASNYILYGHAREGSRAVYDPYTLFLQAHGVRKTANNATSDDPAKNAVIWMFGGSTMRGATPHDERTIPSQAAKLLNTDEAGRKYTVMNFGVNSFNSLLETKYLQKLLIESDQTPSLMVFYDGANDAKYYAEHRDPYGHHGYRRTRALIESYYKSWFGLLKPLNAAVYSSFTKELYDKIHEIFVPLEADSESLNQMVQVTVKRYDHVRKIARCYGAEFVLFWQPMIWVEDCQVPEQVRNKEKEFFLNSEKMATVRKNFGTPYLKLRDALKDMPYFISLQHALCKRTEPVYQPDGVHLTDKGREMVAAEMVAKIRAMRLFGE